MESMSPLSRWVILCLILVIVPGIVVIKDPLVFQRLTTLKQLPASGPRQLDLQSSLSKQDLNTIIKEIPYQTNTLPTHRVLPLQRYQRSVLDGYGNCANMVAGEVYDLIRKHRDFDVVLLYKKEDFLVGKAHTLLRISYRDRKDRVRNILFDVFEGGLITLNGEPVDVAQITNRNNGKLALEAFVDLDHHTYYEAMDPISYSIRTKSEIQRYYTFLNYFYVKLGNHYMENMIYSGIAIIFGVFPSTYSNDYSNLVSHNFKAVILMRACLWSMRLGLLGLIGITFILIKRKILKYRDK